MEIESINGQPGAGGGGGWGGAPGNAGLSGDTVNYPDVSSGGGGWSSGNHSSAYAGGGGGGAGGDDDAGGGTGSWGNGTSYPGTNHHTIATPSVNWKGETSTFGQGGNNQQDGYNGWIWIRKYRQPTSIIDCGQIDDTVAETRDAGLITDTVNEILNLGSI